MFLIKVLELKALGTGRATMRRYPMYSREKRFFLPEGIRIYDPGEINPLREEFGSLGGRNSINLTVRMDRSQTVSFKNVR